MAQKKAETKTFWQKYVTERNFIIFFIILFIVSVVGLVLMSRQAAIDKERQQFMQAKADLHSLYGDIVAKIGEPDAHKSVQSCSYTSSEFSKGYLYCGVYEYAFYKYGGKQEMQSVPKAINEIIDSSQVVNNVEIAKAQSDIEADSRNFGISNFNRCTTQYVFTDSARDLNAQYKDFLDLGVKGVSVMLGCNERANSEYFPLAS